MGFRFRKSKNFGPFRVNVSKSGIGWSVGTKGFRYTKRADGKTQTTYSIPGTGISYVDVKGNNKKSSTNNSSLNNTNFNNDNNGNDNNDNKPKIPFYKKTLFLWLLLILIPPLGIALMWGTKKYNKKPRIALSIIFALYALVFYTSNTDPTNTNIAQNHTSIQSSNKLEEIEQSSVEEQITTEEAKKQKLAEEQAAAEEAEKQKIAQEQAAAEEAERQRIAQEQAAAEEAERQRIAQEQAAAEEAERQRIAQEQAAAEEAERQRIAQEQVAAQSQTQSNQTVQSSQPIGQIVYIAASGEGTKYHSRSSCSNMKGTIQLSVDEAISRGYTACKKCY